VPRSETPSEDTHGPRVPRSSVTLLAHTLAEHRAGLRRRSMIRSVAGLVLIAVVLWTANALLVRGPVRQALAADPSLAGLQLDARFQWYVDFSTLVLDLKAADPAAPEPAFRGLLIAADAMRREERPFRRVVLARDGRPVFVLSGDDFALLGSQFASAPSPWGVLRAIPPKLRGTAGSGSFGVFGVSLAEPLGERDVAAAARRWVQGTAQ
jgi:hypothetical protein